MTAAARTPVQHTTREQLIASYRAARLRAKDELILNAASRAGQLLVEGFGARESLAFESESTWYGAQVRAYLKLVIQEEDDVHSAIERDARARSVLETRRELPTLPEAGE